MRRIDVLRWGAIGYGVWHLLRLMGCRDELPVVVTDVAHVEPTPPGMRTAPPNDDGIVRPQLPPASPSKTSGECLPLTRIVLASGVEIDPETISWQLFTPDTPPISGGNGDDYTTSFNLVGQPSIGVMVTFATHVTGKEPTLESFAFNEPGTAVFEQKHERTINILDPEVQAKLLTSGITQEEIDALKNQILRNPLGSVTATNHYGHRLFRQNCDGIIESAFVPPDVIGVQLEFTLPSNPESRKPMTPGWLLAYPGVGPDLTF